MSASMSWLPSGLSVIAIEGTFDGAAARQLLVILAHLPDACVIDFSRAEDVQLHALGTLLIGFDQAKPLSEVTVRGWNKYHLAVVNSFGYSLDTRGRLYKRAGDEMRRSAHLTNNQSGEEIE